MTTEQRRLWKQAFGDTDAFLDTFEQTAYAEERSHTLTVDGQLAAALYWFDCMVEGQKAAYIYAVATEATYRGRGLCRRLMEETHTRLREQGYDSALLVPGEPPLVAMYEKMGYRVATTAAKRTVTAGQPLPLQPIDLNAYAAVRRRLLPKGGVVQEGENLRFLSAYHTLSAGEDALCAVRREGDTLVIAELLGNAEPADVVAALACPCGNLRSADGITPYAMWLPLKETALCPTYFGLSFE